MLALAVVGWVGAALAWAPLGHRRYLAVAASLAALAVLRRRPALLVPVAFLVCGHLGARADAAYRPLQAQPLDGVVTVLGDAEPWGPARRIEVRLGSGDRVEATAYGRAATVFDRARVGEQLRVGGRLRPAGDRSWLRSRHITGLASVETAEVAGPAGPLHQVPEFLRRRIADGAITMAPERRSLYLGLVIGDDRAQTLGQRLRFRAAGLTHLLAVSGQNVAFVLAVARPLLQAFGYRGRFVGLLAVLVVFAMITRLEPSVLRATATASIAAWAAMTSRERSGLKILALAVVGLIGVDPFLVDSVAFQLSVAASLGILVLQPLIEHRLPGPRWLAEPLATTLAAQIGVSPVLALYFGPISLASIPANLLAGWAAALIMTIGLTVGLLAGLLPGPVATILQLPAVALLWWIEAVAGVFATAPVPRFGPVSVVGLVMVAVALRSRLLPVVVRVVCAILALTLLVAAVPRSPRPAVCGTGIGWLPSIDGSPATMVLGGDAHGRSVEACSAAGIRRVDLLVVERGSASSAVLVKALGELMTIDRIIAPPQHRVVGARRQQVELRLMTSAGPLIIGPSPDGRRLETSLDPG